MNKKLNNFKYILIACVLLAFGSFSPFLFAYQITPVKNQTEIYTLGLSKFGATYDYNMYVISVLQINNLFSIIVLSILTILVVNEVKKFKSNEKNIGSRISSLSIIGAENDSQAIVYHSVRNHNGEISKKSEMNFIKITLTLNAFYLLMRAVDIVSSLMNRLDLANGIVFRPTTIVFKNITFMVVPIVCGLNIVIFASFNPFFKYAVKNKKIQVQPAQGF